MADGLVMDPLGESALPISTGKAAGLPMTPPTSTTAEAPRGLLGLEKGTWNAIAIIANALADAGEGGKPPEARRQKGRNQQLMETRLLQQEQEERKAEREERRALAADAGRMREAEYALKVAEFGERQDKRKFDAFGAILGDLSKALEAGIDPAAVMASSAQRAQDAGLDFMVPMLSGASGDRNFLAKLGPMYDLVKDEPASQVFLARSVALARPGSEQSTKFMKDFQDYASGIAVRTILDRLRTNREAYAGKPFDDVAQNIAPDNPFVRDVLIGAVQIPDPLRKSVENGLRAVGVTTPELAGKRAEEGPPLSQPVKDVLQSEFGVDPRDLDPARKADAALIRKAREKLGEEATAAETEKERRKFSPDLVALRASAEGRVAEAKAKVEEKYRGRGSLTPGEVGALRDDYRQSSKEFIAARDAFARMEDLIKDPARRNSSQADITRLYAFVKMQAPDAVKEGEVALVQQTTGVVAQAANLYNQLLEGKAVMPPAQRAGIEREVRGMFRTILASQKDMEADYRKIAQKRGADPDEAVPPSIIGRFREPPKDAEPPTPAAPPKGAGLAQGRAELQRLMNGGLSRDAALEAMKKAGWK